MRIIKKTTTCKSPRFLFESDRGVYFTLSIEELKEMIKFINELKLDI